MTFIDNIKSNITAIKEITNDAGLFKEKYTDIINIIDTINKDIKEYNKISKSSIYRDVYVLLTTNINYEEERKILAEKIKQNDVPEYNDLISLPDINYKIHRLSVDSFLDMASNLDETDRKSLKKYLLTKNNTISMLDVYTNEIVSYENNMINFRKKLLKLMKHNLRELFNIHACYAHTKHNDQSTEIFNENFPNLIFCNSQKEFIENNLKRMLNIK